MPILLPTLTYNYEGGGYDRTTRRHHFIGLQSTLERSPKPPAVILFCEAKHYAASGNIGLYQAAEAITDVFGVPYAALLGRGDRGPIPPAIFYDTSRLIPRSFIDRSDPDPFTDQINICRFAVLDSRDDTGHRRELIAAVDHFPGESPDARIKAASRLHRWAKDPIPVILGGDLNEQPSGDHYPRWEPDRCTPLVRRRKARQIDGRWVHSTDALDSLVGHWNPDRTVREDSIGFHLISELAWQAGRRTTAIEATIVDKPGEVRLTIDHLIANDAMRPHVAAETFRTLPAGTGEIEASDHIAVYAELTL
jgi:endonuclease/exonuclease/phosphatase family metal-dependent hydrolase